MLLLLSTLMHASAAEKDRVTVTSSLSDGMRLFAEEPDAFASWRQKRRGPADELGMSVVLRAEDAETTAMDLENQGWIVEAAAFGTIQVWAPYEDLAELSEQPGFQTMREPYMARPKAVTTNGVSSMNVESWHKQGLKGKGVRVVVLDIGFAGYKDVLKDELPRKVQTDFLSSWEGSDHGTAVAQIVHDIAPKADLTLYQFTTDAEFLNAIKKLKRWDVQIVNASIGFDNIWHADGTSPYSLAVDDLVEDGVLWIGAAGNENERYRVGQLSDDDFDGKIEIAGQEGVWAWAPSGELHVSFRWSENMEASFYDIDLKAYNEDGSLCAHAKDVQVGPGTNPYEEIRGARCLSSWVLVSPVIDAGANIDYTDLDGFLYGYDGIEIGQETDERSLTLPADALRSVSIGGCDLLTEGVPGYSSRGPTDDGRVKPDFCAPYSASYVLEIEGAATTLDFQGTSAAAPHVAGLAALIASGVDDPTPTVLKNWLRSNAVDFGEEGPDIVYGKGALFADRGPDKGCRLSPISGIALFGLGLVASFRRRPF